MKPCALGFGLSSIAGLASTAKQRELLDCVLDRGITHFDVAPYYGSGDAERILGDWIRYKKPEITVTTKFGLTPPKIVGSPVGRILKSSARRIFITFPSLKQFASNVVSKRNDHSTSVARDPNELRLSVENSLRNLNVETIDYFLLHDWSASDAAKDDVQHALEDLISGGKVMQVGLGASAADAVQLGLKKSVFSVYQFENSLLNNSSSTVSLLNKHNVFTHRSVAETYSRILHALNVRPGLLAIWSRELGVDSLNCEFLVHALLEWAIRANPQGTVLFSTRSIKNVENNASALEMKIGAERCNRLQELFCDIESVVRTLP
jgi:D-threo-aldose 1-dehydrogenase